MRFLLFGTGDYYNRYKGWFAGKEVLALLDNSEQKQHTVIDGREVLPPEEGVLLPYDAIVILSFYVQQMRCQLISLGVGADKIHHFYGLRSLIAPVAARRSVRYYPGEGEDDRSGACPGRRILLLTHDLTLGGPGIALSHAAAVLKKNGYTVVFASMIDGPLKGELIRNGIPVIVDENLQIATMQETGWVSAFQIILCNTLNFHVFLSDRDVHIPVIWWLHDARFFYDGVDERVIGSISLENLRAVSVGPVPAAAVREFLPCLACEELLYGVADEGHGDMADPELGMDRIRFITIGFLEDIKGQDVLLEAVRRLPGGIQKRCEFHIVGHDGTLFGERIHRESAGIQQVHFMGSLDREGIHRSLSASDVLICPSRQDSMPTVAAEAMMHSVPCIVSDAVGTAAYIQDGRDGLIFPSGDARMLAGKIAWCVENREALPDMGKKARTLYEQYFSMTAFEERLMELIDGIPGL